MAQVIQRSNTSPWGQALGVLGQGVSGFTNGMMAKKMLDMWGKNGEMIKPPVGAGSAQATPTAQPVAATQPAASAQPTSVLPSTPANAGGGSTSPLSDEDWKQLFAQTVYKQPGIFGA